MGLCVSKPLESYKSKLEKLNSSVVLDQKSHKITRVNGASLKSLGNALFFPVRKIIFPKFKRVFWPCVFITYRIKRCRVSRSSCRTLRAEEAKSANFRTRRQTWRSFWTVWIQLKFRSIFAFFNWRATKSRRRWRTRWSEACEWESSRMRITWTATVQIYESWTNSEVRAKGFSLIIKGGFKSDATKESEAKGAERSRTCTINFA